MGGMSKQRRPQPSVKRTVLIIECRDQIGDPGSEGRFIKHMLDLMGVANELKLAPSKKDFLHLLSSLGENIKVVHIATHGRTAKTPKGKQEKFTGFWTPDELDVTMKELDKAEIDLSGKIVVSTACLSGQKPIGKAFKKATGCKHYIAPTKGPKFHNAALMCHIFYHKLFVLKRSPTKAFSEYQNGYKNPHEFSFL